MEAKKEFGAVANPDHADLIARLEAATGPDRELDASIHLTLHPQLREGWLSPNGNTPDGYYARMSPTYTASIDAAMTLVPEGCAWQAGCEIDFTPIARVWGHEIHTEEFAATPAIALCIAALKARPAPPRSRMGGAK